MLIDGKQIAKQLYNSVKTDIENLDTKAKLNIILVGNSPASLRYIKQKEKWANYVGIAFELHHFPESITETEILTTITKLNNSPEVTGFLVQLPLPNHINETKVTEAIDPKKDVDGFHPTNQGKIMIGDTSGLVPCTPAGIMEICASENITLSGTEVCVIGRSNIVGKPIANLMINAGATVTSCNSRTKNLTKHTKQADIIIIATGQPEMLTADMVRNDAIVIDVGFSVIDGKILGDAKTTGIDEKGARITPVPGGVGALTVAMIMKNILQIKRQEG